jgi:hypothetical protein
MEDKIEPVKKRGWPKGKPRGPRKAPAPAPMFTPATEAPAPINVRVVLRNGGTVEFGCARRTLENGFHVFFYPSEMDRYRETRREFAVAEIVEIEITEARQVYTVAAPINYEVDEPRLERAQAAVVAATGPKIHSVRKNASSIIGQLENSSGPIKMNALPNLSFGDSEA